MVPWWFHDCSPLQHVVAGVDCDPFRLNFGSQESQIQGKLWHVAPCLVQRRTSQGYTGCVWMRIPYSRCVVFFWGIDDLMGFISKNFNALHESCDCGASMSACDTKRFNYSCWQISGIEWSCPFAIQTSPDNVIFRILSFLWHLVFPHIWNVQIAIFHEFHAVSFWLPRISVVLLFPGCPSPGDLDDAQGVVTRTGKVLWDESVVWHQVIKSWQLHIQSYKYRGSP